MATMASAALAAAVALGCGGSTEPHPVDHAAAFDQVWKDFDEHYAFFGLGNVDWNALRATYRDSTIAAASDADAARLIGAMIGRLNDYHADLTTPYGTFGAPAIPYPHHFSPSVVQASYFAGLGGSTTNSHRIYYARLRDGIGYVHLDSFEGSDWGGEIDDALKAMGDIKGLIVDIRDNGGGNEGNGRDIAARFYDVTRTYRLAQYRNGARHTDFASTVSSSLSPAGTRFAKPVALITNRFDGSAAEDFALMMRVAPNVVTVGDTTLGLGSNPLSFKLANGWTYRVPQSIQSTPDGFVYQWKGLPPAIAVKWDDEALAAGHDPYVDAALASIDARANHS